MAWASVVLPDPLGPMIACVCPDEMVRFTPRRTSRLSPAASVTLTRRSRISRVDISVVSWILELDEDVAALDLDWVGGYGFGGRRPGRLAGPHVETRSMQPALHRLVVDLALREGYFFVRADVVERVDLAFGTHDSDRHPGHLDAKRAFVRQVSQRTGPMKLAHASSASTAAAIRSWSSGTSIWPMSSPKKPRMTSRLASSAGIPRAIR